MLVYALIVYGVVSGTPAITIPNFASKEACEKAAIRIKKEVPWLKAHMCFEYERAKDED